MMALPTILALDDVSTSFNPYAGARRLIAAIVIQAIHDAHTCPSKTPTEILAARANAMRKAMNRHGSAGKKLQAQARKELTKAEERHAAALRLGLENVAMTDEQCSALDFLLDTTRSGAYLEWLDIDPGVFRARVRAGCGSITGWITTTSQELRREWFRRNLERWRVLRALPYSLAAVVIEPPAPEESRTRKKRGGP